MARRGGDGRAWLAGLAALGLVLAGLPSAHATLLDGGVVPLRPADAAFAEARVLLEERAQRVGDTLSRSAGASVAQHARDLDLAQRFHARAQDRGPDAAIQLAMMATAWQAESLGTVITATRPATHASPSQALHSLLQRHGVAATAEQERAIQGFASLPEAEAAALTRLVDAFLAFEEGVDQAYANADKGAPDFGRLLDARDALLDALPELTEAFPAPRQAMGTCAPVAVPPVFSIDLSECGGTYSDDFALLLDAGGDDTYLNNAGGSGIFNFGCAFLDARIPAAATLVDLGGNDRYASGRSCGINGGAAVGAGFLFDQAGSDAYAAGSNGVNGGGYSGVGFLLDGGGDDTYVAGGSGTNGGGDEAGVGLLLDEDGADSYVALSGGTNGGAYYGNHVGPFHSVGFLADRAGNDSYAGGIAGTNGGGAVASGFLFDGDGNDFYTASASPSFPADATNGGGAGLLGTGFLFDGSGDDGYDARTNGANGGGFNIGSGFLLDLAGDDTYLAGSFGVNGGASNNPYIVNLQLSAGLLLDAGGTDRYRDDMIPGGSCGDCTILLKGIAGAQLDQEHPAAPGRWGNGPALAGPPTG